MVLVCLLLTACNKDDVLPARPMEWSYEIITPANVQFLKSTTDVSPSYFFETNGKGGNMVMTCENYDVLNPISGDSYVYDCGWTTLKIEGNQVKIHFPPSTSNDVAHEEIQISAMMEKERFIRLSVYPKLGIMLDQQPPSRRGCPKKQSSR